MSNYIQEIFKPKLYEVMDLETGEIKTEERLVKEVSKTFFHISYKRTGKMLDNLMYSIDSKLERGLILMLIEIANKQKLYKLTVTLKDIKSYFDKTPNTIYRALRNIKEKNVFKKLGPSYYFINPKLIIIKGIQSEEYNKLLEEYNQL